MLIAPRKFPINLVDIKPASPTPLSGRFIIDVRGTLPVFRPRW